MLSIGLMSGTSMDGIDAALLETDGNGVIKELGHSSIAYKPAFKILLKSAESAVKYCQGNLDKAKAYYPHAIKTYLRDLSITLKITDISSYLHGAAQSHMPINFDEVIQHSTQLHSVVVKNLLKEKGYKANQIDVVGYHGQTLYHCPSHRITIQIGDGQYLADQLGITVVNDFRSRDVALGGQGAPFAPIYHQALAIRDQKIPVAVVNCGGIANITFINSDNALQLIAFDTGPGNGLIDRLVRQYTHSEENMDKDGKYGKRGKVNQQIFKVLYEEAIMVDGKNYFQTLPPKSLDYNDMHLLPALNSPALAFVDACRTLEAFTADTIVNSLDLVVGEFPRQWILAGGGWKNPVITEEFKQRLNRKLGANIQIETADEAGWNNQALEAQIFAYLAVRSLQNQPISVPSTTQVPVPLSGGRAYTPANGPTENVKALLKINPTVLNGYQ